MCKRNNYLDDRYKYEIDLCFSSYCTVRNRLPLPKLPIGQLGSAARNYVTGDYIRSIVKCNRYAPNMDRREKKRIIL